MLESLPVNLKKFERRVYSQHGEDGIIEWLLPRTKNKLVVEIGCGMTNECQATNLVFNHGFKDVLADKQRGQFVTAENVNDYAKGEIGVLSIDVDGNDYWLWKAIRAYPDIVCIEYNSWLPDPFTIPYDANFVWKGDCHWFYGASLGALYKLAIRKGYQLVGCDSSGNNAFFIRENLGAGLPDLTPEEAFVQKKKHMTGKVDLTMLVEA